MSTHLAASGYTIKEASRLTGLPESTLRYYETIGIIEPIARDSSSKHRVFSEENLALLDAIACLSATGLSIGAMRRYLANRDRGAAGAQEQIELLRDQQRRLTDEARRLEIRQAYVQLKITYWQAVEGGDSVNASAVASKARKLAQRLKN